MRLLVATIVAASTPAWAGFPAAVPMDGPFKQPCAKVGAGETCKTLARAQVGGVEVVVAHVFIDAVPAETSGEYDVAVHLKDGWYTSHESLGVEGSWREHGPNHVLHPRTPDIVPLHVKRPAVGVDIPIDVDVDDEFDTARQPGQPVTHGHWSGSPVALIACGETASGAWACLPPVHTSMPHDPVIHFAPDGHVVPDRDGWHAYDVTDADRVDF